MENLISALISSDRNYDIDKITEAYRYSEKLHEGQFRQSGEPYISHPVAVARIVMELGLDTDSICAALLHDTVEDCPDKTSLDDISRMFGSEVAFSYSAFVCAPPSFVGISRLPFDSRSLISRGVACPSVFSAITIPIPKKRRLKSDFFLVYHIKMVGKNIFRKTLYFFVRLCYNT